MEKVEENFEKERKSIENHGNLNEQNTRKFLKVGKLIRKLMNLSEYKATKLIAKREQLKRNRLKETDKKKQNQTTKH